VDEAIAAFREAIRLQPDYAPAHYNLGNALWAKGKADEAIAAFRGAIRLQPDDAPAHCNLGHALLQQGHFRAALEALRRGHQLGRRNPRWPYPSADWVRHCEQLVALDARLPALLQGDDRPKDAAEQMALADLCQRYKRRYAAAARFYAAAFAAEAKRADDLRQGYRYNAACAAALAAAGQGKDAGRLDDKERARLRAQALGWLRADLALWAKRADRGKPEVQPVLRRKLLDWQKDPDLAGLRDQGAVDKLPAAERAAWGTFWAEVDALLRRLREAG
jgi:Tfp pilus assembly protein PilF